MLLNAELLILTVALIAIFLVGLFTLSKNPKSSTNQLFSMLALTLIGWTTANYFSVHLKDPAQVFLSVKVVFFFVVLQNTVFLLFASVFPGGHLRQLDRRKVRYYVLASIIIALVALFGAYFSGYVLSENGQISLKPSPLILIFLAHTLLSIGLGIQRLIVRYKQSKDILRNQLLYLVAGSVLLLILVPLTNFLPPIIFGVNFFASVSPIYTFVFSGIIAYAIVKQKLFDIKLVVARSVAYVLLIGSMALTYSAVLFGIVNVLFAGANNETIRQAVSVILVFPIALSFQSIKNFFDRLTNRIFYKDSYDPQAVLNRLGRNVAAETDLNKIVSATRLILTTATKSSFVEFLLFGEEEPYLVEPTHSELEAIVLEVKPLINDQHRTIMLVDNSGVNHNLKQILASKNVSVVVRLKSQNATLGFILFGEKKNGEIYNSQDIKLLRIVSSELAIAVQNALQFEEIEQFNLTLQQKVDDATHKLRQTNDKLKKLDETKDDFISMASHQLRTPLTSVKGYISMVLDGDAGKINKQQHDLLNQSFVSAERMVYLIADLLNVSRLRTGKFVIEPAPTNLVEVIDGEIAQLTETAKGRGLELKFERPKNFPRLELDETKIRQVIMNFADNAIYYTPSGGHITVKLEEKPESVEFTVVDDGIGVPKAEQHHLFNKFYRAGNARKARPDGTGLGLFMAKKVIVASGGAIIFHSEEGKGSTFGFSFPKRKLLAK